MKQAFFLFIFGLFLISCAKNDQDPISDVNKIPDAVTRGLKENFPDAKNISFKVLVNDELWKAEFSDKNVENETIINKKGQIQEWKVKKGGVLSPFTISDVILKYIEAEYPGSKIVSVNDNYEISTKEIIGQTIYIVTVENKNLALEFDAIGAFISVTELPDTTTGADEWSKYEIKDFNDLPENIKTYLNNNHQNFELYSATGVVGPKEYKAFYVTIKIEEKLISYEFDGDANVKSKIEFDLSAPNTKSHEYLYFTSADDIPLELTTYLDAQFAGWKFLKGFTEFDEKKEVFLYLVVAQIQNDVYYISFDKDKLFTGAKKG